MSIRMKMYWLFGVSIMFLFSPTVCAQQLSVGQILNDADRRIEDNRKAKVTLILVDDQGEPMAEGARVRIQQTRHQFLFGCNFFMFDQCGSAGENTLYQEQFKELFNFATLGFYWSAYEPEPTKTRAQDRLKAARWCKENGIGVKGHPLVWTFEPGWLQQRSAVDAENRLWLRIRREVEEFDGLIDIWDVLNEPCVGIQQGKDRKAATVVRLYEKMNTTPLIRKAFMTAENANPDATLILNDYNTSQDYEKVLDNCLTKGNPVKIDAIGIQSHMHSGIWPPEKIWDVCERFGRFNKPLHFTEVTIVSGPGKWENWGKTHPFHEEKQAEEAAKLYTILFSHPSVEAITWWDFSDQGAWQKAPAGLVRDDMSPKPAYTKLKELIKETWWTDQTVTVQRNGRVRFTGFLGDYQITQTDGDVSASYTLNKDAKTATIKLQ